MSISYIKCIIWLFFLSVCLLGIAFGVKPTDRSPSEQSTLDDCWLLIGYHLPGSNCPRNKVVYHAYYQMQMGIMSAKCWKISSNYLSVISRIMAAFSVFTLAAI